jgi:hypothetical protein
MLINNLISQTTNSLTNFYQDVEKLKEDITWQEPGNKQYRVLRNCPWGNFSEASLPQRA